MALLTIKSEQSNFTYTLPEVLKLNGEHEIALCEIIMSNTPINLKNLHPITLSYFDKDGKQTDYSEQNTFIPQGYYTIDSLINTINEIILKYFDYEQAGKGDIVYNRGKIKQKTDVHVEFIPYLQYFNGKITYYIGIDTKNVGFIFINFTETIFNLFNLTNKKHERLMKAAIESLKQNKNNVDKLNKIAFNHKIVLEIPKFMQYQAIQLNCNLCQSPLKYIPYKEDESIIHYSPQYLQYVMLTVDTIDSIKFEMKDVKNNSFDIQKGYVIMTLHIRPKSVNLSSVDPSITQSVALPITQTVAQPSSFSVTPSVVQIKRHKSTNDPVLDEILAELKNTIT